MAVQKPKKSKIDTNVLNDALNEADQLDKHFNALA